MNTATHHFFELLWGMTEKELHARYKYTFFGFLWLVANPVLQMCIIGFVFTFFMKEPVQYYYHHLFAGLLVWNFFSVSLSKATPSIVNERSLIKKSTFPRMVVPLSIILSNAIHFISAYALFLIPVAMLGTLSAATVPFLLIALSLLIIFTTGLSLLTCALNVRYRDINFFVQAALTLWFYATPILYSLTQMPRSLLWLWRLNPMTSILQLFQHALLGAPTPGLAMLTSNIMVIFLITVLGVIIFHKESRTFDDWV
jgi:ABC-2 type transport system permease protein